MEIILYFNMINFVECSVEYNFIAEYMVSKVKKRN